MKHYFYLLVLILSLTACGSNDDNDPHRKPAGPNANANDTSLKKEYGRLEFPKLRGGAGNRVVIHSTNDDGVNYSVEWNDAKKSQRWSCYQMYKSNLVQKVSRYKSKTNQYPKDPQIPAEYAFDADPYWSSGYDHGHICPSEDRRSSFDANYQTFYMSNMQPQLNGFNAGVWLHMENAVREWAKKNNYKFCDTLYVCKGGTIDHPTNYTKTGKGLLVPKYFFMAVLRVKNGQYNAIGFWVEHNANNDSHLAKYAVSIKELEEKTGIDFFCNLPDAREKVIESTPVNYTLWDLK